MAGNKPRHDEEFPVPRPEPSPPGHEERDVNVWAVGKVAIALGLLCICSLFLLLGVFRYFQASEGPPQPLETGGVERAGMPPAPRLQKNPVLDLQQMRASEDQILGSYGWVDRSKGVVRLPIGRAIDILARQGLPTRPQTGETK